MFSEMKNLFIALGLVILSAVFASAQSGDIKKGEVFVGYSNGQIDTGVDSGSSINAFFRDRQSFNGFEVSGVYNVSRYIGIKGDFSGHFNRQNLNQVFTGAGGTTTTITTRNDNSLYNFLGGVQVKDNSDSGRWKPFAHALVGGATERSRFRDVACTSTTGTTCPAGFTDQTFSDTGFAGAFGGGLDVRISHSFQIRLIQIDYNPVHIGGFTNNNARIGAGIVF
jgi:hypothetical protein